MKRILGIVMGLVLVAAAFAGVWSQKENNGNFENQTEMVDAIDIKKLCVSVSCGEHYGCGTIYDSDDSSFIIVTAMHVLEDYYGGVSDEIVVTFDDQESCEATILKDSATLDIVFLSVDKGTVSDDHYSIFDYTSDKNISSESSNNVKSDNTLLPGQTIYFVDANTGDIYAGSIASPSVYAEDFGMEMIYCYCAVTPGMSGTGMFDEDGHYLGILLGGSDEAEAVCLDAGSIRDAYLN
ncbi:S1 family peptidase [Butyrivibrio sp. NC2007]|uniref:S1 family peptidase n=1 Tax=Butyrivibrio sp. NC2007 TaxID=1280683 RepID=UPI0003FBE465|nr:serine protease [Butyrivibrio sp. NC2007]